LRWPSLGRLRFQRFQKIQDGPLILGEPSQLQEAQAMASGGLEF
jgi:hypothetical protein